MNNNGSIVTSFGSFTKKNFEPNTKVKIIKIPENDEMYNVTGVISGKSYDALDAYGDFYIITLDKPLKSGYTTISITESCLEQV